MIAPRGTHALIAYGPLLILLFYATWLAGRVSLGYWPQSSIDDPKFIEGFWMWTYNVTAILFISGLPIVTALAATSVVMPIIDKSPSWRKRLMEALVGIALIVLCYLFIFWDPQRVVEWYLD